MVVSLKGELILVNQLQFNTIEDRYLEPPEPKTLFFCDCCGNDIYEGEECYITEDKHIYCTECVYKGKAQREEE